MYATGWRVIEQPPSPDLSAEGRGAPGQARPAGSRASASARLAWPSWSATPNQ